MARRRRANDDEQLIEECLAGNSAAWQRLQDTFLPGFRSALARKYGKPFPSWVEQIGRETFASLFEEHMRRLRAFDVDQATFASYLLVLAGQELARLLRTRQAKG